MDAARPPDERPPDPAQPSLPSLRGPDAAGLAPFAPLGEEPAWPANESGIPGRTRPRFEELPPGPPTWPAWVLIIPTLLAWLAGFAAISYLIYRDEPPSSMTGAAALTVVAGILLCAGLAWIAWASIRRRSVLGPARYRGASLITLLAIVIVISNTAAVPLVTGMIGGASLQLTLELLLTPFSFIAAYVVFVTLPQALPGVRLWAGTSSAWRLVLGIGLGVLAWLATGLISALAEVVVRALTGHGLGGEQAVVGLTEQVPFAVAVVAVGILAPVAEELFFRGAVLNAWEREYGTRRAFIGSALLFAAVHLVGGTPLAVAEIFLLGLLLAWVYLRTRSLAATIGLHGAFNLASLLALFVATR